MRQRLQRRGFLVMHKNSLRIQHFCNVRGESNERGARINGGACILELKNLVAELDLIEVDFPVSLAAHGCVHKLPNVGGAVYASKYNLATVLFRFTYTEGKDGFVKKSGVKHLIERRPDVVDSNSLVRKTEDAIKPVLKFSGRLQDGALGFNILSKCERQAGLLRSLSKEDLFHSKIANSKIVPRNNSRQ